jgi:hypothetical protein
MQLQADRAGLAKLRITGTVKVAARHIGRMMQTVAEPLFDHNILLPKKGAF